MEKQNLNELRQIMTAEQEAYRAWLLELPPEEILNHAWEYTAREDVIMALENWNPSEKQASALLKSPCPLADVVKEYRDMDVDNEQIITALEDVAKLNMEPPIYQQTAQYAIEHGERDAYFASKTSYEDCKKTIEESIARHHDGYYFSDGAVQDVMQKFSVERVKNLLAYTVQKKDWDGRFSRSNKEWARSVETGINERLGVYFTVESHPALLDGFISMFRREVLERGVGEKSAERPQRKPEDRSNNIEL